LLKITLPGSLSYDSIEEEIALVEGDTVKAEAKWMQSCRYLFLLKAAWNQPQTDQPITI
jgi:hypothetical protein